MTPQSVPLPSPGLLLRLRAEPDNQEVWTIFADRYYPVIYSWCCSHQLNDAEAEDTTQAVLLLLIERMRSSEDDPGRGFRPWLRTVTCRAWRDHASTLQAAVPSRPDTGILELLQSEPAADDLARLLEQQYDRELLDEATRRVRDRVDEATWEAYRLTAEMGQSAANAADTLETSVSAVFKGKSQVVKMLRDEISQLEQRT
jgi:RNA polymerase sigma-70 factor (ECF subfamily)